MANNFFAEYPVHGNSGPEVISVNGLSGALFLVGGPGITITDDGINTITISASGTSGGTPNTFAGYNASGDLESIPEWSFNPDTFHDSGLIVNHNVDMDPVNFITIDGIAYNVQPSADAASGMDAFDLNFNWDPGGSAFNLQEASVLNINAQYEGAGTATGLFGSNIRVANNGTGAVNNITALDLSANFAAGSSTNFTTLLNGNVNLDVAATLTGGFSGYRLDGNIAADLGSNGIEAYSFTPNTSNNMTFLNGFQMGVQAQSGTVIANGYNAFSDITHFFSGSSVDQITSLQASIQMDAGTTTQYAHIVGVFPTLDGAVTGDFAGLIVSPNGSGTIANASGIEVNMQNLSGVTSQRHTFNGSGGVIENDSTDNIPTGGGIFGGNNLSPSFTTPLGSPVTGTSTIANNLASTWDIQDDTSSGSIPGQAAIGVGFVGGVQVAAGKTLESMTWALGGSQVSGDGTITDYTIFNALGALPSSGTPIVTNLYGFRGGSFLSAINPVNLWGISIDDANAENFFQKSLAINTTTHKVGSSATGLELFQKNVVVDTGTITVSDTVTDTGVAAGIFNASSNTTVNGSNATIGINGAATGLVQTGAENDKSVGGMNFVVTRGDGTDGGILDAMTGANSLMFINSDPAGVTNQAYGFSTLLFSQQGTVTDLYDFFSQRVPAGTGVVTNHYGVYINNDNDTPVKNWLSGSTQMGGSSFGITPSALVDLQGVNGVLKLNNLTTADEGALTAAPGMILFNTDTVAFEGYDGTSWIPLSGGGGGGANQQLSNLTNPTAINQNLTFNVGGTVAINTPDVTGVDSTTIDFLTGNILAPGNNSGNLNFQTGNANGAGVTSGANNFTTGNVQDPDGSSSGAISFTTGNATGTVGAGGFSGGDITFATGSGFAPGTSGRIVIQAPLMHTQANIEFESNPSTSGYTISTTSTVASPGSNTANLNIITGDAASSDNAGTVTVQAGNATTGSAGGLVLNAGSTVGNGSAGNTQLIAGSVSGGSGNAGSLIINAGSADTGSPGGISMSAGSNSTNQGGDISVAAQNFRVFGVGTAPFQTIFTDQHILAELQSTTAPGVAPETAGAGTGASANFNAASNDIAGQILITTGVGAGAGPYVTVTFNTTYPNAPIVILTVASVDVLSQMYVTSTTSGFTVNAASATDLTNYLINYMVIGTA